MFSFTFAARPGGQPRLHREFQTFVVSSVVSDSLRVFG